MNNNNLDQISMQSSKRKRERFNFKHSFDTSAGIGEIQCMFFQEVQPNSNSVVKGHSTIRLDPMVVPTAGELNLHHNIAYVGIDDLFPKFASLLAEQPTQFGLDSIVPDTLPYIGLNYLTALCMIGAKFTFYNVGDDADQPTHEVGLYGYSYSGVDHSDGRPGTSTSMAGRAWLARIQNGDNKDLFKTTPPVVGNVDFGELWQGYDGPVMNIARLLGWSCGDFWVPTRNWSSDSLVGFVDDPDHPIAESQAFARSVFDIENISLGNDGNNDVTFTTEMLDPNGEYVATEVAVKFSSFGQRLFKLLCSMGYGFSLNNYRPKSLAPMLGMFKCWFDSFAPTLYQGWETTNTMKILSVFDSSNFTNWNKFFVDTMSGQSVDDASMLRTFCGFIFDLCSMWYTEEQDAVTMYIRNNAVTPASGVVAHMTATGINVNDKINIDVRGGTEQEPASATPAQDAHAYINNVLHSALDSEVLKRLYKVVNRNTIAGRRIKQLLEAQGLGEYVKNCRSNFISHSAVKIDIFDVTATADTLNKATDDGMYTGEYVGKGVGDGDLKRWKFNTEAFGYIYDLAAIVPEAGWTNSVNAATENLKKLDFYNGEWDALGYEAARKDVVTAVEYSSRMSAGSNLGDTFGYAPRDSRHKVKSNVLSGYFALHSRQKAYLPYTFNKFVELGGKKTTILREPTSDNNTWHILVDYLLDAARLPIASPMYRFIGKYPWMGRFRRIFADLGIESLVNTPQYFNYFDDSGEKVNWFFNSVDVDNFVVHNVWLYDYYAPMLAIEDSFETHEEGNTGYTDLAQGKA